jgi:hypothetical protein
MEKDIIFNEGVGTHQRIDGENQMAPPTSSPSDSYTPSMSKAEATANCCLYWAIRCAFLPEEDEGVAC